MTTSSQKPDTISDALGMVPIIEGEFLPAQGANTVDTDYEYARTNIKSLIDAGNEALANLASIATSSQHPRSYEVLAGLIKTLTDANKDLLELQKRNKDLTGETGGNAKVVNNNLFVGSNAELLKMIKGNK